jgi:regulator of replication initiation timing
MDGIKSLDGILHVYILDHDKYIRQCCFKILIPSIYNFINNKWFLESQCIVDGEDHNNIENIYKIDQSILKILSQYATETFKIIEHKQGFKLLSSGYINNKQELTLAYQTIIRLEKDLKDISYKFSSVVHDNNIMSQKLSGSSQKTNKKQSKINEETELMKREDRINPSKIHNKQCAQCNTFSIIKDDLKLLKKENFEKISLVQYEYEIATKKMNDMKRNFEIVLEENIRLKEENKLLRATNTIYSHNIDNDHN